MIMVSAESVNVLCSSFVMSLAASVIVISADCAPENSVRVLRAHGNFEAAD